MIFPIFSPSSNQRFYSPHDIRNIPRVSSENNPVSNQPNIPTRSQPHHSLLSSPNFRKFAKRSPFQETFLKILRFIINQTNPNDYILPNQIQTKLTNSPLSNLKSHRLYKPLFHPPIPATETSCNFET